ncbi:MAG: hypothetical protein IKN77_02835 [Paludibacteraceae bacterium]|nr:hypothetical protein [Paludibacteraceae bacterium]
MRIKYGFFASVASLALGAAGFFSSCEDKCVGCQCESFIVDHVVNADSMDVALTQLDAKTTVVIVGSGLSTANGVYLVDADNVPYSVYLNPTFVTDNAIVVTLDCEANNVRTERLLVTSSSGCQRFVELPKPVPAPSIKMFYSEFVPDGDTLRIAGNAFLSVPGDELKVFFYNENNERIPAKYEIKHDNCELLVVVPEGVADSKPVTVSNKFGECTSSMLFRDSRNIFLDFDKKYAWGYDDAGMPTVYGSIDSFAYDWCGQVKAGSDRPIYDEMLKTIGGKFPAPCNNYYQAITSTGIGWNFSPRDLIYYIPASIGVENTSLLGDFLSEDLENLVLKFEVYVPSQIPLAAWFDIVFSGYGTEDKGSVCKRTYRGGYCEFYSRDLTLVDQFDEATYTCDVKGSGVPAAWLNMASFSVDDTQSDPVIVLDKPFDTGNRWMTVAVPLKSSVFRYNPKSYSLTTNDNFISCGHLDKNRDFGNFLIHCDAGGSQGEVAASKQLANRFFVAFDNFRIVPEDGGGVRFTKYYGATPASKYPF